MHRKDASTMFGTVLVPLSIMGQPHCGQRIGNLLFSIGQPRNWRWRAGTVL